MFYRDAGRTFHSSQNLYAIEGEDGLVPLGTFPRSWLDTRTMGSARIDGVFADIYGVAWVSQLRRTLAGEALRLGMKDIDLSSLEKGRASQTYATCFTGGLPAELRWRLLPLPIWANGRELGNLRLPFPLEHATSKEFSTDDPDLLEALRLHGIKLG